MPISDADLRALLVACEADGMGKPYEVPRYLFRALIVELFAAREVTRVIADGKAFSATLSARRKPEQKL